MDSGLNAVVHLEVELGELVLLVSRGVLDITKGGRIDDITDNEALDGLVLGDGLASGGTPVRYELGNKLKIYKNVSEFVQKKIPSPILRNTRLELLVSPRDPTE